MTLRIAAIYTTFRPEPDFRARIDAVVRRCAATIVVDNTPGGHDFPDTAGVHLLQDRVNKGLGGALNLGIAEARRLGCEAVVLFDQDSTPAATFVDALAHGYVRLGAGNLCVGPRLHDDSKVHGIRTQEVDLDRWPPVEVTCLPTSGMFFGLTLVGAADLFSEDLFLDFVDFDWCWKMRTKGWRFYRLEHLQMLHRLGLAELSFLGLTFHVPAPYRHYFQFRDTLRLLRRRYVPGYSKWRLGLILLPKLLLYPFILDRGVLRFRWMVRGIRDAIHDVSGVGAAASTLTLHRQASPPKASS